MEILSGLSEGQVLQRLARRGASATLLGRSTVTSGPVFATVRNSRGTLRGWNRRRVGAATAGIFRARLTNLPPGGPYRLELRLAKERVLVESFYVGDVWLLAGQSNMAGVGNRDGAATPHPLVRAFSLRREWRQAQDALHVVFESPDICHHAGRQASVAEADDLRHHSTKGVGVGVFFGREMVRRTGVPQGLICTAHGGTTMEQWSPTRRRLAGKSLYASMLRSCRATGQPVAGVLWYQGESDAEPASAPQYTQRMRTLVAAMRRDLRQPRLPWIVVQIARLAEACPLERVRSWNSIQEQQRLLPRRIPRLLTVPAIDLDLDDTIHISSRSFPQLAHRLADTTSHLVHRDPNAPRPIELQRIAPPFSLTATDHLDIHFAHVHGKLLSAGAPRGFALTDATGRDLHLVYKTTLHRRFARVHFLPRPLTDLFLSYGTGTDPVCTITDQRGASLPVFGPLPLSQPHSWLPFVRTWQVSPIIRTDTPLARLICPDRSQFALRKKTYPENGFINEWPQWQRQIGHGYFFSAITLPQAMKLTALIGYDGPFRLWINGRPVFANLRGTNPCFPDESAVPLALRKGRHTLTVAMDLNAGRAWGFFLRFVRRDRSN